MMTTSYAVEFLKVARNDGWSSDPTDFVWRSRLLAEAGLTASQYRSALISLEVHHYLLLRVCEHLSTNHDLLWRVYRAMISSCSEVEIPGTERRKMLAWLARARATGPEKPIPKIGKKNGVRLTDEYGMRDLYFLNRNISRYLGVLPRHRSSHVVDRTPLSEILGACHSQAPIAVTNAAKDWLISDLGFTR